MNLQSNALKFTPKGGSVTLVSSLSVNPPQLTFEVIDTGIGIKEEDKSKLFKLFGFLTNS